jgi:F-type H+-transporting ATPase subunit epsilon
MATLFVEIVTPEAALWAGEALALIARSSDGDFTILPQHTSTVGDIVPGIVRVQTNDGELSFCVHGGYFQVGPDDAPEVTRATVLAGIAEKTTEIDVARAETAKDAAEAQLAGAARGESIDPVTQRLAEESLARAQLRLSVSAN